MKKLLALMIALALALCACALAEEEEENYDTGDATLDLVRNEDGIGEKELLVASFGTSYNDSRRLTIGGIEAAIDAATDCDVRRGFTSQIIIDHVERRDGIHIDSVAEALDRAVANGVKTLVIQPTHLMRGFEYDELVAEIAKRAFDFECVAVGEPLLASDADCDRVADILIDLMKPYDDGKTAIVYMGHGTEHAANAVYAQMQAIMADKGAANYYVGTVEAEPSLEDVMAAIGGKGYSRVVLRDMMVVAGDHANNDMAGDEPDSWKSILTDAGYKVECVLEGLGQVPEIQAIYVEHAMKALADAEG